MEVDNQEVKEETFIQSGRRGGDGQPGGEESWQGSSWRTGVGKMAAVGLGEALLAEWAVSYSSADKPGGITGEGDRPGIQGLQCSEIKPPRL